MLPNVIMQLKSSNLEGIANRPTFVVNKHGFGSPCAVILPGSFSAVDQSPVAEHSQGGGTPPLAECTATGNWSNMLKLP